jgi:hypothetical protein
MTKIWLYPRPSCLNCSFSQELSDAEINTCVLNVLDYGANLNPRVGPTPFREGVASAKVSLFRYVSVAYEVSYSHHARDLAQGLDGAHIAPWGISLPEDVVKREANRARNKTLRAQKERKKARSAAR